MNEVLTLACIKMEILNQDVVGFRGLYERNSTVSVDLTEALLLVHKDLARMDGAEFADSLRFMSRAIKRLNRVGK